MNATRERELMEALKEQVVELQKLVEQLSAEVSELRLQRLIQEGHYI